MRFSVRREDRRNLLVGFVGLMTIMTAHSVMETARDTLFLTNLPATELPAQQADANTSSAKAIQRGMVGRSSGRSDSFTEPPA